MLKHIYRLLIISSFLILAHQSAGARDVFYKSIASAENIQSAITVIYAEPRGYVWFGTSDGLVRFDNFSFRTYSSHSKDSSIPGDHIYQICEDSQHNIWVLTDNGTAMYNPVTDSFEPVRFDSGITDDSIASRTFFCTSQFDGGFYAGSVNCLYRYDMSEGVAKIEKSFETDEPFSIDAIFYDSNRNLMLLNKAQGFLIYNPMSGQVTRPDIDIKDNHCAFIDSHGRIWRSQFNKGLECYSSTGSRIAAYTSENSKLSSNIIFDIAERNGDVWAARSKGGVILLREMYMRSFYVRPSGIRSDNTSDKINCIASTPDGMVWLGTHGSGLLRFRPEDESIYSFAQTEKMEVASMVCLDNGNLLFVSYGDGLYEFNPKNGNVSSFFFKDEGFENYLRYSGRQATLAKDGQGNILILANKAFVYDQKNHKVTEPTLTLPHDPKHTILPVSGSAGKYFVCQDNVTSWDGQQSLCLPPEKVKFRSVR